MVITIHGEAVETEGEVIDVHFDRLSAFIIISLSDGSEVKVRWTEWLELKLRVADAV